MEHLLLPFSLTMHKLILLVAFLARSGHAQHVEISIEQPIFHSREPESPRALAAVLLAFNPAALSFKAVGNTWNKAKPRAAQWVPLTRCSHHLAMSEAVSRRAILSGAAAALISAGSASAIKFDKRKDYITMDQYEKRFIKNLEDKETYGWFQVCAAVMNEETKFKEIAEKKVSDVEAEALRWDQEYRVNNVDKIVGRLEGDAKAKGEELSKQMLAKLKKLDSIAKRRDNPETKVEEIAAINKEVTQLFSDFVDLAPKKLLRFGELKQGLEDL